MGNTSVRQLVLSSNQENIVIASFEKQIKIMNLENYRIGKTITTNYDFGGKRCNFSDQLSLVISAAYIRYGLVCYSLDNKVVWDRKDIKKVQTIEISNNGLFAYCGIEGSSLLVIDLKNGSTIDKIKGVKRAFIPPKCNLVFLESRKLEVCTEDREILLTIKPQTFGMLDVVCNQSIVIVSEATGNVRCFDINKKELLWTYFPTQGSHIQRLCLIENKCFAIARMFNSSKKVLHEINLENGNSISSCSIEYISDACFIGRSNILMLDNGYGISLVDYTKKKYYDDIEF